MEPEEILAKMADALGEESWTALSEIGSGEHSDPFKVLIGTILSQRTRDERTAEATERLFRKIKCINELADADPKEVAKLIKGVGFYNVKSKSIIEVSRILRDQYGGKVPKSMKELLNLPSVGRKTANCVLVYGFKVDAIPVDTHVHRISNRLGISHTKEPDETEEVLKAFFPRKLWKEVNDLFVRYGKAICKPVGPKCGICPLKKSCEYFKNSLLKK
jgi:endonuclease-3